MTPSAVTTPLSGENDPKHDDRSIPPWDEGELPEPPAFQWSNLRQAIGPGVLMAGAAIGAGEWLIGPKITATYGGSLLWLSTISILAQVVYNLEIMRYALYTGEPIFTGKFRIWPGPLVWILLYIALDFGTVFPYVAANAATPVVSVARGVVPVNPSDADKVLLNRIGVGIFLLALLPMIFGGKIYDSLKTLMMAKIVVVLGFLAIVGVCFSRPATWWEITSGFAKFGTLPVETGEDRNGNGQLDPGEDWDGDGRLDEVEPLVNQPVLDSAGNPVLDKAGKPVMKKGYVDIDKDGRRDGPQLWNPISGMFSSERTPRIDFAVITLLSALIAISGQGGLNNTPLSNYTRDQGWGMGKHVGAIPSLVGGHDIQLSHVGMIFRVTTESLQRWQGWLKVIWRDQVLLWAPACFVGIALPSMLSVEFLPRGTSADDWAGAGLTANAVRNAVSNAWGSGMGQFFWYCLLFCGFLVLMPTAATTVDGFVRRWVDGFWTASPRLRKLPPSAIKSVFFSVLAAYTVVGIGMLLFLPKPTLLLNIATTFYNYAFGISCFHVIVINRTLLPRELQSGWFVRGALAASGVLYLFIAVMSSIQLYPEVVAAILG